MARYSIHPADSGGHYHNIKLYKDRRPTFEQVKEQRTFEETQKETEEVTCIA